MAIWNPLVWLTDHFSELQAGDQLQVDDGTVDAPAIVSRLAADTGIYYTVSSVLVSVGGTLVAEFSSAGVDITGSITATGHVDAGTVYSLGGNTVINTDGLFLLSNYAVASLPAGVDGAIAFVTDANETWADVGTAPTGGGSNKLPVYYAGGGWLIG